MNAIEIADRQRYWMIGSLGRPSQNAHILKIQLPSKGLNSSEFLPLSLRFASLQAK
jgi:hypothetical protein